MKEHLLKLVHDMREDGVDFNEQPIIFHWDYKEEPNLKFSLMVNGSLEYKPTEGGLH